MQEAITPISQKPKEVIAVIGAGLAGCISAIYLAKAGYDVLLIEEKNGIMSVTSKIPVHLHSGGLYIKGKATEHDMEDAYHCLHDSINFMKAMSFAVVPRLTAFAVMSINDEHNILPNGKTQLLDEATDIYREELRRKLDTQKANYTSDAFDLERKGIDQAEIPDVKIEEFKQKALTLQFEKWEIMQKGFAALQKKYEEMIHISGDNKVFGDPRTFFSSCSLGKFSALKEIALSSDKQENDFSLDNKEGWTLQLARVTDPKTIIGVVMSSELGLNMIRAQAGIQMKLESLKGHGVTLALGKKVEGVSRVAQGFALKIRNVQDPIVVSQIVNAAGHQGKDIDLQMGYQLDWSVDVKGVGIIELIDKEFDRTP